MKFIHVLILIAITTFSVSAFSSQSKIIEDSGERLLVQITSSYVLGDGDTRIDGKNIALQNAKKAAAEMAGSYIEAQMHIVDDEIKNDSIKVISTALLSTKVLQENISLTADQRTRVQLVVEADLDKKSLMAKLGTLKNNSHKKGQILQLKKDNEALRKELSALNQQIASLKTEKKNAVVKKPRPELMERRDQVLSKIEINEESIRKVFAKGTLFSLAKKSSRDFDAAKEDIENNVWKYIQKNLDLTVGEPRFKDNGNNTYDIEVPISWKIFDRPIMEKLNKYFWAYDKKKLSSRNSNVQISGFSNKGEKKKLAFSDRLFNHLTSKVVAINLSASHYSTSIQISACRKSFFDKVIKCGGRKTARYDIQFALSSSQEGPFDSNPAIIKNVPISALESLTAIDAKVVVE